MTTQVALSAVLAIAVAGCAAQETQVARADCKIAPITTRSVTGRPGPVNELDRRYAEMQLATSDYRRRHLQANPFNNIEDALKDCR